jgi:cell division protein FtsB
VAEEFYAAFGLGSDARYIGTVDADGVALAAIQALHQQNRQLQAENQAQDQQIQDLHRQTEDLLRRLEALETGH